MRQLAEDSALSPESPRPRVEAEKPARVASLRRVARRRRYLGWLLLLVPALAAVALDFLRRSGRLDELGWHYRLDYAVAVLESMLVWATLLYAAARRSGAWRWVAAVLFVLGITFSFGGQQYFFDQYHAYLNVDVSVFASNLMDSVWNQLFADIGTYLKANLPPFLGALALVWIARRTLRPRRRPAQVMGVVAPLMLVAALFIPTQHRELQACTPDVLYLNAVGGLIRTQFGYTDQSHQLRPKLRHSLPVPHLAAHPARRRNVLFLLLESVRADATCIKYDPDCKRTEASNLLLPHRYPFTQMRSLDSTTAISLSVLWSGTGPQASRKIMHTWPLIFDYARAAGYDTAYWTSQNMLFGNARLWVKNLGVNHMFTATDLDPTADLDMGAPEGLLAKRVDRDLEKLKEPWMAVVHFSNVHYPYYIDPKLPQPFQPATTSKAPEKNASFKRYYQNSVYQQDLHLADIVRHLRATPAGRRTVIVYTSDHAESFREHGQMGHTFNVLDDEVHVPAWIDAPPGTLSGSEQKALEEKQSSYVFHVDIAPTILDLMGVWDDPAIAKYKTRMEGHSLLRPVLTTEPLAMTNCGGVWSCAFENWGYIQGHIKLEARAWDVAWHCYNLASDPFEKFDLGMSTPVCRSLRDKAMHQFGRLPGKQKSGK